MPIPVIIGEMGCYYKNNDDQRYEWAKCFISTAKKYGIACIVWDDGGNYQIFDRRNLTVIDNATQYLQGFIDGLG